MRKIGYLYLEFVHIPLVYTLQLGSTCALIAIFILHLIGSILSGTNIMTTNEIVRWVLVGACLTGMLLSFIQRVDSDMPVIVGLSSLITMCVEGIFAVMTLTTSS